MTTLYYIDGKPFPIVRLGGIGYCYVRAVEQILYSMSVRSTGVFASMMRKMGCEPWVVHSSTDISEAQRRVVMDGMRCLMDAEAMGRVRRSSIVRIEDCTTTLAVLENVNDKAKLILEFFEVEDDSSYLGHPDTQEKSVRKRTQTDHFQCPPSKPKRGRVRANVSSPGDGGVDKLVQQAIASGDATLMEQAMVQIIDRQRAAGQSEADIANLQSLQMLADAQSRVDTKQPCSKARNADTSYNQSVPSDLVIRSIGSRENSERARLRNAHAGAVGESDDARNASDESSVSTSLLPPMLNASDDAIRGMETGKEMEMEPIVWQDDAHESLSAIQAVCKTILSSLS